MSRDEVFRAIFTILVLALGVAQLRWRLHLSRVTQLKSVSRTTVMGGKNETAVMIAMPLWATSVFIYMWDFQWFDFRLPLPEGVRVLGLFCMALCLPFSIWTFQTLGVNFSAKLRLLDDHKLIQVGPYRYTRHPMYATFILCALGSSLASANLLVTFTSIAATTVLLVRIKKEEEMLRRRFGVRYIVYVKATGAILPKFYR